MNLLTRFESLLQVEATFHRVIQYPNTKDLAQMLLRPHQPTKAARLAYFYPAHSKQDAYGKIRLPFLLANEDI